MRRPEDGIMTNINKEIERYKSTPGAVLIDLRNAENFEEAHIPGAIHMMLQTLEYEIGDVAETDTSIFLYCYAGKRSSLAESMLKELGYENAVSIGGTDNSAGELE